MRADLYQTITIAIIDEIAKGAAPGQYRMPWHRDSGISTPRNAISGRNYRGINTLLLWAAAGNADFPSGEWATYRQWVDAGAQVRKGERATVVLLWSTLAAVEGDKSDGDDHREPGSQRVLARAVYVFNAAQVDGYTPGPGALPLAARFTNAESFFAALPAKVSYGSDDPFFDPVNDNVFLPAFGAFTSAEAYYSVYAHELIHWTGAKARLDRDFSGRFASESYAMEELVAELGAAFTVGYLGLASTPRNDHASYIASWLSVLRADPRAIVTAASKAQAAADYLITLAEPPNPQAATAGIPIVTVEQAA
ncbi:zincin-like metallopeptidase domain-containing protein [Sphingomonas sp. LR59]|uniref:ArdC family protein n=1 Tax=Sphingomonas sp. LR59 TaxID=3050232 RepID=UPI002FE13903